MHRFSKIVYSLYEAAECREGEDTPAELLRILRAYLGFDGAVLGMGATEPPGGALVIDTACVVGRDPAMLADYASLAADDPIAQGYCRGLTQPFICSCDNYYARHDARPMRSFARRHGIAQLLLFGAPPTLRTSGRWLAAYRGAGAPFGKMAAEHLAALWPHLLRCHAATRHALLGRLSDAERASQGYALVSRRRVLEAADPAFARLFWLEWPYENGCRLPAAVWQSLDATQDYFGVRVRVSFRREAGHVMCRIAERNGFEILTPAERIVALQYGKGRSNRQIAEDLAVSSNTVRTHVAHVFEKLAIHTKTELVRRLAAVPEPGRPH
jgi:DNA-binding CsgD family transcriptional regulator